MVIEIFSSILHSPTRGGTHASVFFLSPPPPFLRHPFSPSCSAAVGLLPPSGSRPASSSVELMRICSGGARPASCGSAASKLGRPHADLRRRSSADLWQPSSRQPDLPRGSSDLQGKKLRWPLQARVGGSSSTPAGGRPPSSRSPFPRRPSAPSLLLRPPAPIR